MDFRYEIKPYTVNLDRNPQMIVTEVVATRPASQTGVIPDQENIVTAQWDTGANMCCISKHLASRLGLKLAGRKLQKGVGQSVKRNFYLIDLYLPNGVCISDVEVIEGDFEDVDILIGLDVILKGDFCVSHDDAGNTVFSFVTPPCVCIDFTQLGKT